MDTQCSRTQNVSASTLVVKSTLPQLLMRTYNMCCIPHPCIQVIFGETLVLDILDQSNNGQRFANRATSPFSMVMTT